MQNKDNGRREPPPGDDDNWEVVTPPENKPHLWVNLDAQAENVEVDRYDEVGEPLAIRCRSIVGTLGMYRDQIPMTARNGEAYTAAFAELRLEAPGTWYHGRTGRILCATALQQRFCLVTPGSMVRVTRLATHPMVGDKVYHDDEIRVRPY